MSSPPTDKRAHYMRLALSCAQRSPPKPTNFRVGAVLVDADKDVVLATGYTLELPGNTHAEQCCLMKLTTDNQEGSIGDLLPSHTVIYTTMEPCTERLSGNTSCVDRILQTQKGKHGGIRTICVGVYEPSKFVEQNNGRQRLIDAGIEFVHVPGFEDEILKVATQGHSS